MQKVVFKPHELPYEVNEELKYLRANIQFCGVDKKVILMTSSVSGEGKSTLTRELAKSMAELGKRVLLIDSDLRRSMLKNEVQNREAIRYGLTHYLSGMASLDEALAVTEEPVMYVLFAGPVPPNPSELLSSKRVDQMLDWARTQFDYILIDSAPLGTVIDAAVLAPKCDGSVIVVEAERVPYRAVQNVAHQLKGANCPILGVILNKVNYNSSRKYYNHYYRKYGYEYKNSEKG